MPDKLTDNEIKKALECCNTEYEDYQCPHCPLLHKGCKKALIQNALDLINRYEEKNSNLTSDLTSSQNNLTSLQAENERLQDRIDQYNIQVANQREQIEKYEPIKKTLCVFWETMLAIGVAKRKEKPTLEEFAEAIDQIKAEAYKEFAERLKECAFTVNQFEEILYKEYIDNLLKEMGVDDEI